MSNQHGSTSGTYPDLHRFNRVTTSNWTADISGTTDFDFCDLDISYDRASNITWVEDQHHGGWDDKFALDGLNRLTHAERGPASGGPLPTTLSSLKFDQQWTLDQVGNWNLVQDFRGRSQRRKEHGNCPHFF